MLVRNRISDISANATKLLVYSFTYIYCGCDDIKGVDVDYQNNGWKCIYLSNTHHGSLAYSSILFLTAPSSSFIFWVLCVVSKHNWRTTAPIGYCSMALRKCSWIWTIIERACDACWGGKIIKSMQQIYMYTCWGQVRRKTDWIQDTHSTGSISSSIRRKKEKGDGFSLIHKEKWRINIWRKKNALGTLEFHVFGKLMTT